MHGGGVLCNVRSGMVLSSAASWVRAHNLEQGLNVAKVDTNGGGCEECSEGGTSVPRTHCFASDVFTCVPSRLRSSLVHKRHAPFSPHTANVPTRPTNATPSLCSPSRCLFQACPMLSADVKVNLVTFFEDVGPEAYQWVTGLPVSAISLDFTRGDSLKLVKDYGFPKDKVHH